LLAVLLKDSDIDVVSLADPTDAPKPAIALEVARVVATLP
jgi:hypothetical protein